MDGVIACRIDADKKKWQQIAMTGSWKGHGAGEFSLSTTDLMRIVENFERIGLDVPVDYEHQSLYGEKAPASGWIRHPGGLKVDDDKLFARIEWTTHAKEQVKNGEYRYLSPTLMAHATDPVSGEDIGWMLHSVALTNTPFFNELPPIAANSKPPSTNKENTMTPEQIAALQEENKTLKDQLEAANKQVEEHTKVAATAKVKEAIAAKKLHPDQEKWACDYAIKDPKGFDAYLDAAKPAADVPPSDQFAAANKPDVEPIGMDRI